VLRQNNPTATQHPGLPEADIEVVPNPVPAEAGIYLRFTDADAAQGSWRLFHSSGKSMASGALQIGQAIPTAQIPAGTYWLQLQPDGYRPSTKKVIILK
jgi:hypothetical protein